MAVRVIRKLRLLYDVVFTRPDASAVQDGDVVTYVLADDKFYVAAPAGGGGGPPTGPAGGVLGGTYPNPSFAADMATQAELDANAAASVNDGDAAGGVLSGTYPNPGFAVDMATQAELDAHVNDASDAHDASAISVVDTGGFYTGAEVEAVLQEIGAALGVTGSGESVVVEVTQNAHGLSVGDWVKRTGSAYALAQADSAANAEVFGVVSAVADVNNFSLTTHGVVTGLSGLTTDVAHFLSPSSAGDITATPPSTAGQISKPVLLATSTTAGIVVNMRGMVVGSVGDAGGSGLYDAFAQLRDQKAANTGGGTFTSGAWRTRDLQTEHDPDGFVTLAANQFTLDAGTYLIQARAPGYSTVGARHKAKLRNVTDSTDDIVGSSAYIGADDMSDSIVEGEITITGTKTFEIQHQIQTTENTVGFGVQSNFAVTEVYTEVLIWRRGSGGSNDLVWIPFTGGEFLNGAADFGDPNYYSPAYAKAMGLVFLRGGVNPGSSGEILQLPVGYRPSKQQLLNGFAEGSQQNVEVFPTGIIDFFGDPTASAFLDGMVIAL